MSNSKMITFAFPYMNGPLHLGHLYTMLNGWVLGRQLHYDDFFMPFGFHCTGMPIYANAMKLRIKDATVIKMLSDLNISKEEFFKFENPEYWVEYFPQRAMETLGLLNLPGIDLSRSFVTTSVNPYFNKFVEWQWTTLKNNDYVSFKNRPCIYSIKDQQPCAAHDRQTGEESVPVSASEMPKWIKDMPEDVKKTYILLNIKHQQLSCDDSDVLVKLLLPSEKTLSRSGDLCIVATTGQWYVNYSDELWKKKTLAYIANDLIVHDQEVHKGLLIAAENMHEWCISREYGLGTRIPWDPRYLIDSLSDSTIYPMYYNFCDLLQGDLMGQKEGSSKLHPDTLTVKFWDAIFKEESKDVIISTFQKRIKRVQMRVSGKDLIYNHLVMAIYHGVAFFTIYKREEFLPKEYHVNGYIKIDNEKMSKSLGNFITLEDAIKTYPKKSLIMTLIEAGDGINDANVRISDIPAVTKSLEKTIELISHVNMHGNMDGKCEEWLNEYAQEIRECLVVSTEAWKRGRIREAITYGWRKMLKVFETYRYNSHPSTGELNYYALSLISYTLKFLSKTNDADDFKVQNVDFTPILKVKPNEDVKKLAEFLNQIKKFNSLNLTLNPERLAVIEQNPGKVSKLMIHHGILNRNGNRERINEYLKETFPDWRVEIIIDETVIHEKRDPYKVKPILIE